MTITNKEKRLKSLKAKLSFYESKLFSKIDEYQYEQVESISTNTNHQEAIMLNVAIDDIREEIDRLES